jgi:hypothetical protein
MLCHATVFSATLTAEKTAARTGTRSEVAGDKKSGAAIRLIFTFCAQGTSQQ